MQDAIHPFVRPLDTDKRQDAVSHINRGIEPKNKHNTRLQSFEETDIRIPNYGRLMQMPRRLSMLHR